VGNTPHVLVSELSARRPSSSGCASWLSLDEERELADRVLKRVKDQEYEGYHYEAATPRSSCCCGRAGPQVELFHLETFRIIVEKREDGEVVSEATIKVHVGGERFVETAEGNGPVNALDTALRQAIERRFPRCTTSTSSLQRAYLGREQGTRPRPGAHRLVRRHDNWGASEWGQRGRGLVAGLVDSISYGLLRKEAR